MESTLVSRMSLHATRFEALNAEAIAAVEGCSDEQWRLPSVDEGRSVAVVAHHIAEVQPAFDRLLAAPAAGETSSPTISTEQIDASNARHAVERAGVGKAETLGLSRMHGAASAATPHGLGDDALDRDAGSFGGHEVSVEKVVEWIAIGRTAGHPASIEPTLAA